MRPTISTCCWWFTLRSGAIVIGWFLVVCSIFSLIGALAGAQKLDRFYVYGADEDVKNTIRKLAMYFSPILTVVYLIIGVLSLVAVYLKFPIVLTVALVIYLFWIFANFLLAAISMTVSAVPLTVTLLISSVVNMYFLLILFSYGEMLKVDLLRITRIYESGEPPDNP